MVLQNKHPNGFIIITVSHCSAEELGCTVIRHEHNALFQPQILHMDS